MQHGLANHVWCSSKLVEAALNGTIVEQRERRQNRFTAIDGDAG